MANLTIDRGDEQIKLDLTRETLTKTVVQRDNGTRFGGELVKNSSDCNQSSLGSADLVVRQVARCLLEKPIEAK